MSQGDVLKLAQDAVRTTLMMAAPMLIFSLIVGLIVSIFQAVTQIQEATLAFVPKIVAVSILNYFWTLDNEAYYPICY